MSADGDELVARLLAGLEVSEAGEVAHRLLYECFRGYSVEALRPLLVSKVSFAVESGAWIVSELGAAASPLIDALPLLFGHENRKVSFWAVDFTNSAASVNDGAVIAGAITLASDKDDAVRWRVLDFLVRASRVQLESAIPFLEGSLKRLDHWLLMCIDETPVTSEIEGMLSSDLLLDEFFAGAAAIRFSASQPSLLELALASTDEQVHSLAVHFQNL
jgi:hypothetical protein